MRSANARGALFMSVSMAAFAINDGFLKLTFQDMSVLQAVFLRGAFASAILLALVARRDLLFYRPPRRDVGPISLRAFGEVGATAAFMAALANMPIANATAVLQAAPLAVTMAAALILGERVGWRRWTAIGVGFVGMLFIVQPGTEGFDVFALFAVAAVVFIVVRDLGTRQMSDSVPKVWASALSAVVIFLCAAILMPLVGWRSLGLLEWALVASAAVFLVIGYFTNVISMREGEVSVVAPFRYTVLIWALVIGYVLFAEIPGPTTLFGAAIVTLAGLYTLWREHRLGRDVAARASARPFGGGTRGQKHL
ncbi:MAG: DMT family transporter [Pseudomonadota bacterium]